jgi:transcriptional regulator with XRE-family HTH domain
MTTELDAGSRIRQRRSEIGMTQQELAQLADISTGFISEIEKGKRNPSGRVLLRIAGALGTTTDWILRGVESGRAREDQQVVVPPELSEAARRASLSYTATVAVLRAYRQVVAERGGEPDRAPSTDEWLDMYRALRRYIEE